LDIKGNVIGKHDGIINFTIGQRKGIGISHEEPLYVVDIIAKENKVIVGDKKALSIESLRKAISLDKDCIGMAKEARGSYFDNIRESPEFQALIRSVE